MTRKIELATERLIVRTPDEGDVHEVFALMSDPEIAASVGFRPMCTPSEAEGAIRKGVADEQMFVIEEKGASAHIVGVFEVAPHRTQTVSGERCDFNLCYFLRREARGKGYMTEVVEMMKDYLFTERKADSLTISVLPRNDASRRVALKNGFTYERLDRNCGISFMDELVDLEFYVLDREEYLNPGKKVVKEKVQTVEKQKWINEGGILYPIPGYATLLPSPGRGVFRIYEDPRTKRLGLEKIDDSFTFSFKIYDLDCEDVIARVIRTWTSDLFSGSGKNLGVIFNGLKGTGKTIAAKLLCNRMGLPAVVISRPMDGLLEFIQSLCFECVILIDEAEKTFSDDREVLLKMIDGVYNNARKLYVLTTNRLTVDENLLGRPGRIRYIKEFSNLPSSAINEVIDDNLRDKSLKEEVLKLVDTLEISTIDILKSIVDECNIMGEAPSCQMLNIPRAKFRIRIITFDDIEAGLHQEVRRLIISQLGPDESVEEWLMKTAMDNARDDAPDKKPRRNKDMIEEKYDCRISIQTQPSVSPVLYLGQSIRYGTVASEPDGFGFFTLENDWDGVDLCCMGTRMDRPSLYRGRLF